MKKSIILLGIITGLLTTLQARTLKEAITICDQGDVLMCQGLGDDFREQKKPKEADKYYKKALAILKKGCEKSANADMCFGQADMLRRGQGVKADKKKARKLYKKAKKIFQKSCKFGDRDSCDMLMHTKMRMEML